MLKRAYEGGMTGPDADIFRSFLFRATDRITPSHLFLLRPRDSFPLTRGGEDLTREDGLVNTGCSAAVADFFVAESAIGDGYNIGCLVHPSGLMVLNIPLVSGKLPVPGPFIVRMLQETLMIQTASGGYQVCFLHDGISTDSALLFQGWPAGDVIGSGYIVCPGSFLPAGEHDEGVFRHVTLLNTLPPARFDPLRLGSGLSLNPDRLVGTDRPGDSADGVGEDFCTEDGVSLEFLRRKISWVDHLLIRLGSDSSFPDYPAATDLARLGFSSGTIARILIRYRGGLFAGKRDDYAGKVALEAVRSVQSAGRVCTGRVVEGWLSEEMNWRLCNRPITRDR